MTARPQNEGYKVQYGWVCARFPDCQVEFREAHGRPVLCVGCHKKQEDKFAKELPLPKAWFEEK